MSRIITHSDELAAGEVARFEEGGMWYIHHICGHRACFTKTCSEEQVKEFAMKQCQQCRWPHGTR